MTIAAEIIGKVERPIMYKGTKPKGYPIIGAFLIVSGFIPFAIAQPEFVRDGEMGFVVSHIQYALSGDTADTGACPDGMNHSYLDPRDAYINLPDIAVEGKRYEEAEDEVKKVALKNPQVKSLCLHPELGLPSPDYRPVSGSNIPVFGIDLDGQNTTSGTATSGTCPHADFPGANGEPGIDNQYFRVVGCNKGYQPRGQGNSFNIAQLAGAWGILIKLNGVDDIHNDDNVAVNIYANGDPIRLSPDRKPLPYATYTVHKESRFQAQTRGYIKDDVLYTEPVEVRIPYDINAMYVDRVLRDARLQVTLGAEGGLEGYLAGYAPVEEQYDLAIGFRSARVSTDITSELGSFRLRMLSGIGKAGALGYTCEGVYHALRDHADGHPDPETGECTSISTQYQIKAIPAFVVEGVETVVADPS